jgi:hypothetical protein
MKWGLDHAESCFSSICSSLDRRDLDRDGMRILVRHSETHRNFRSCISFSSSLCDVERDTQALRRSRAKIGASERKDKKANFNRMSGDASNDDTVFGVAEGVEATVCRISPI